jgi:P-type conjugative transfer protein TrbL
MEALAAPAHGRLVSSLTDMFSRQEAPQLILNAAKRTFWALATMGLVWNMGVLLLRRGDFGELFLELIRFIVFTGLFYWLLTESSSADGFVYRLIDSFAQMGELQGPESIAKRGDNIIQLGLWIFYKVLQEAQNWSDADILVAAGLSLAILTALTLLAAQLALVVIMAWMLAYAGIFLLGLGGTRWTSPAAIGFYKNVLALGASLMLLALLTKFGYGFLREQAAVVLSGSPDNEALDYVPLADMFVVSLLLAVLGMKVPSLIYKTVTGSPLGLLGGTASLASNAFSTGGSHMYTTAYTSISHYRNGGAARGSYAPSPDSDGGGGGVAANAIDAIRASSAGAAVDEAIFTPMNPHAQSDAEQASGSVFSQPAPNQAWSETRGMASATSPFRNQGQAPLDHANQQPDDRHGRMREGRTAQTVQAGTVKADTTASESTLRQLHRAQTLQSDVPPQARYLGQTLTSAALPRDASSAEAPSAIQQAVSTTSQSSSQSAIPAPSQHAQEKAPLGLTHATPDLLAGNLKLGEMPHQDMATHGGFQPEALADQRQIGQPDMRQASVAHQAPGVDSTTSSPPKGHRPAGKDLASGTSQPADAIGRESPNALPAPAPNPLSALSSTPKGTNMTEQVGRIAAKTQRNMASCQPSVGAPDAGLIRASGDDKAGTPASDEVAAFRDRHLSKPEGE